ncbi:MAG TPA: endonuclease/exonuclease/phosphatase family protein [Solirubrobacterales bacterium]|nr:endonuclease/exonuclease/phosphatase family protein [Solirubrobacterales bacterium]
MSSVLNRRLLLPALALAILALLLPSAALAKGKGHGHHGGQGHHGKHGHHGHGHHGHGHGHGHHGGNGGHGQQGKGHVANVMTRNLYLGADLTPAILAPTLPEFVAANGQILREVTANNFPVRAEGLADEILAAEPDLVGLQEVALWRTAEPSLTPVLTGTPTATTVRYDYLAELLAELGNRYEVVVVQNEFDLEAPADENGVAGDGPNPAIADAEINGRLTMRDVILARRGAGVQTQNPQSANFTTNLVVTVSGVPITVKRGWTATDAKVRGTGWFRFVNTHLEAFQPLIRQAQAAELVAPTGPATSELPVVLVGDLNSDDDTVEGADRLAYETLLAAGMVNRSTDDPLSCCLDSSLLEVGKGGSEADFDHQVDHILTRDPDQVTLVDSQVSGIQPVNGFWNSDHAGVFSALRFHR